MTLDMELKVPEYDTTLKYHSTRPPDEAVVKKLCESLDLAREIVEDACANLAYALTDPADHPRIQQASGDTCIPDNLEAGKEAARYHFKLEALTSEEARKEARTKIFQIMTETDEGLNRSMTLSDSLNYYTWNDYAQDEPRVALGKSRAGTEDEAEEGHVKVSGKFIPKSAYWTSEEFVKGARSIHIEFSLAAVYPPFQLARLIVHEATHKFAGTSDHAYTYEEDDYEDLTYQERVFNADSYAYVVISIALNKLIKNENQLFEVVPQDYQRTPKKVRSPIQKFVGEKRQDVVQ
jgi:hypothetical protein